VRSVWECIQRSDYSQLTSEKPSWFRGYGGSASVGNWSSVTCKLTEEGDKCSLNVYVDVSILLTPGANIKPHDC